MLSYTSCQKANKHQLQSTQSEVQCPLCVLVCFINWTFFFSQILPVCVYFLNNERQHSLIKGQATRWAGITNVGVQMYLLVGIPSVSWVTGCRPPYSRLAEHAILYQLSAYLVPINNYPWTNVSAFKRAVGFTNRELNMTLQQLCMN